MAVVCGSCGQRQDKSGNLYCRNPFCGALLPDAQTPGAQTPAPADLATTASQATADLAAIPSQATADLAATASQATADLAATASQATAGQDGASPGEEVDRKIGGRHRKPNGQPSSDAPGSESSGGYRPAARPNSRVRRWLVPVAALLAALLTTGVVWLARPDPGSVEAEPPADVAPVVGDPEAAEPTSSTIGPTDVASPDATATPPIGPTSPPRSTPSQPQDPAPGPTRSSAPPRTAAPTNATLSASARTECVWAAGGGWVLHLSGTVRNGTARSATGWHGSTGGVHANSYRLSISGGTTISGTIPPNDPDTSELFGSSAPWSMTVTLSNGQTLSNSGTANNPC
ncbi:hypothetical protein GCM10027280_43780 [Micromonospora polyrhachis]|uniref:Uncharacterized protein n=1 Tax=Micromonospora polyrhachis TaxID=1282883 RepID=A0A7W7SVZ8_9ACTN|nr:hypothetical protein [Micromonospora polyrhachis]MBB4961362.1 hypothetical protein [Micromonospora polyrhachis]